MTDRPQTSVAILAQAIRVRRVIRVHSDVLIFRERNNDVSIMNAVNVVAKNKRNKRATAQEHKVANAETEETTMGTEVLHGSRAGWVSTALKRAACFVGFTMMILHGVLGSQRTLAAVDSVIAFS